MLVSAVANDGILMKPYLLERVETYEGTQVKRFYPAACGSLMTQEEARILTEYMEAVVTEGTGSKLNNLGFSIAGKTGTAEYSSDKNKSHAWFAGFSNTGESDIRWFVFWWRRPAPAVNTQFLLQESCFRPGMP